MTGAFIREVPLFLPRFAARYRQRVQVDCAALVGLSALEVLQCPTCAATGLRVWHKEKTYRLIQRERWAWSLTSFNTASLGGKVFGVSGGESGGEVRYSFRGNEDAPTDSCMVEADDSGFGLYAFAAPVPKSVRRRFSREEIECAG